MIVVIIIIGMLWAVGSPETFFPVFIVLMIIGFIAHIKDKEKLEKTAEEKAKKREEERIAQENLIQDNNIPSDSKVARYRYGYPSIEKNTLILIFGLIMIV